MKKTKTFLLTIALLLVTCSYLFSETPSFKRDEDYKANIPTQVIKKFTLPKGYHEGLFFDGEYIWVCNGKGIDTWGIDPSNGKVISKTKPTKSFTEGMTADADNDLWATDWEEEKLYRIKKLEDEVVIEHEVSLTPAHPAGVVWAKGKLYVVTWTRGVSGTKYHLLEFSKEGEILNKTQIKRIHEPAHLAWDGKYLWITSWYSQLVYKVDVDTFSILGSFRSPASQTTGIAWDGKYFWITGTHAALYQIEVNNS